MNRDEFNSMDYFQIIFNAYQEQELSIDDFADTLLYYHQLIRNEVKQELKNDKN